MRTQGLSHRHAPGGNAAHRGLWHEGSIAYARNRTIAFPPRGPSPVQTHLPMAARASGAISLATCGKHNLIYGAFHRDDATDEVVLHHDTAGILAHEGIAVADSISPVGIIVAGGDRELAKTKTRPWV